ncbi:MAG: hypothetical protein R3F22_01860 [Lysobacteraceae bacterium]
MLVGLFPSFAAEWDDDEWEDAINPPSFHCVFMSFAPIASEVLEQSSDGKRERFCALIDHLVECGGDRENAVSTCFLEHASQIGVRRLIQPYLSIAAKAELR